MNLAVMNNNMATSSLPPSMRVWNENTPDNDDVAEHDKISWDEPEDEKTTIHLTEEFRAVLKMRNEFENASFEELAAFRITYNEDDYDEED